MSVAMTNCGTLGWVADRRGYRYDAIDPQRGCPWPSMPASFPGLAQRAAAAAGFEAFEPNACLINRYAPGARLSLHQDKDEGDFRAPIVSVSLGISALFLLGGMQPDGQHKPRRLDPRRRAGLGRAGSAALSRRVAAEGRPPFIGWRVPDQPDISQSGLSQNQNTTPPAAAGCRTHWRSDHFDRWESAVRRGLLRQPLAA